MNTSKITPGKSFSQEMIVTHKDTAAAHGSGKLEVFATPALVCLMENTALKCLKGILNDQEDTVGVFIDVKHVKATGVGKKVGCRATIGEVDGRRIRFAIEAWDEVDSIAVAVHDRVIIDPERFMKKIE
ncbi:MAG: thioesterase family protein [Odoribacteraceae bacterium]|jgi:predicted thioesterase|nr:thioesterase family protein [Odoribacteraceae bacterium]